MHDIGIRKFYELIGENPPESAGDGVGQETGKSGERQQPQEKAANDEVDAPAKGKNEGKKGAFGTLQAFIDVLERSRRRLKKTDLKFYKRGNCAPTGHSSATLCRPDVAIFRPNYSPPQDKGKVFWGSIEMAIEFHSAGKTHEERLKQAATYAMFLLEARPDLVSGLGLLVELNSLVFFFCNADGINKVIVSEEEDYLPLLSAVMRYLDGGQKLNLDPTLDRARESDLFHISFDPFPSESRDLVTSETQPTIYSSCRLHDSHDPFGRRPNVFIYKPANDVTAIRVIKDQYIRTNRRWEEKDILEKMHRDGTYPAVVRMCRYEEIPQARCGDRIRVRICLQDYGTDFLSLETPRDMIYALYDLLEVTRGLYFDRKILHRDISPWNVMIRSGQRAEHINTCSTASPVFIRHLLNPQFVMLSFAAKYAHLQGNGREPKHKSSIFLIDFGYSQDLGSSKSWRTGRTGTPNFIARAVQAGKPLPSNPFMLFPGLPPLSAGAGAVYESNHPKRMELFNGPFTPQVGPAENIPSTPLFQHKLAHDGESSIWSAVWWSIQASAKNGGEAPISMRHWDALMPKYNEPQTGLPDDDGRNGVLHAFVEAETTILHPGYSDLVGLFQNIAAAILPDYHWAADPIRQEPDFVHEILQRMILNFVIKNKDKSSMDEKKADTNRMIDRGTNRPHSSVPETESRRSSSITSKKSSVSCQGRKRKLKETVADPAELADELSAVDELNDTRSGYGDDQNEDTYRFVKKSRKKELVINVKPE